MGFGEVSVIGAIGMVHVAQVEVTATIDQVGFGEAVATGFIDTADALEVGVIATIDATGFAQVDYICELGENDGQQMDRNF